MTEKGRIYPASHAFFLDSPLRRWLQPPSELAQILDIKPKDTVVDFGCGPGFYTIEFAKRAKEVIAADLQQGMLDKAKLKAKREGVANLRFLQTDGKSLQLSDESADKIVLVTVFHEVAEPEFVLKEFARVLKQNGKLIIAEVTKKGIISGAPVQNPAALQVEIEAGDFRLEKIKPYKSYGILFFAKNTQ
jgi:ubiquinone/menaquinone biosynthesis C-methylase UbiE